uniref:Uncharacterized protein n=1 Tax=Oncorhynchus tshawytscha TaxID=74940 RepID=A0AAZ3R6V6_ONCTS
MQLEIHPSDIPNQVWSPLQPHTTFSPEQYKTPFLLLCYTVCVGFRENENNKRMEVCLGCSRILPLFLFKVTQHDGLFLPRVIWTLVSLLSLLLQILWLPLWVLWWFASSLLWLICLCVEFIMSCLLQVFAWLCNATYFIFNVLVYVCGIVYILNLEGRPT